MNLRRGVWAVVCLALLAACVTLPQQSAPLQPEIATGFAAKPEVRAAQFAVASANPLATRAGYEVLKAGGSAVDAAVAVQMVLGLVEPQSSGLGGGAFMLHSANGRVQAFDGRETAPAAATEDLFVQANGQPMAFYAAVVGGRAVGTPGVLRMLAMAHAQHGKLPWARLFAPAIELAQQGFAISPRLHALLKADVYLPLDPAARAYFYQANGEPYPVGHVLRNPALARVLQRVAKEGPSAFYQGEVAQAMVRQVQQHASNPGRLSLDDLAHYQAKERQPLCVDHAVSSRVYQVCGFPPPSSGGIAVGQMLGLLAHAVAPAAGLDAQGLPTPDWLHAYAQASRLVFADRAQYVADPDFVAAPAGDWQSLLDPGYLKQRAQLMGPQALQQVPAGVPRGVARSAYAPMPEQPEYGTSHLSIVDAQGHAVAMTTTLEDGFGARQMVHGFFLNNELTDFSFAPRDAQGQAIANRVQAGKRPRSSMSPTLVFDKATGQLVATLGSPGGAMIIHFTTKTLYGVLHWGLSPQQAIALPNYGSVGGPVAVESGRFSPATLADLRVRGHVLKEQDLASGIQGLVRHTEHGQSFWLGGADPRREGEVQGD